MRKKLKLIQFIGLIVFIYVLTRVDFSSIVNIFKQSKAEFLLLAVIAMLIQIWLRALRWGFLLKSQDIKTSMKERYLMILAGAYYGSLTPGKLGEFIRMGYLRQQGNSAYSSIVAVFIDRILDIIVLIALGSLSLFVVGLLYKENPLLIYIAVILWIITLVGTIFFRKNFKNLNKLLKLLGLENFLFNFKQKMGEHLAKVKNLSKRDVWAVSASTFLFWLVNYIRCYFLILALNINLSFFVMLLFVSVALFVALMPISFSGLGTRDITIIYLFSLVGLPADVALTFSISMFFMILLNAFLGFFASWRFLSTPKPSEGASKAVI
jgi:hypothetical protein